MSAARGRRASLLTLMAIMLALAPRAHSRAMSDIDNDGLPDEWETQFGLDPNLAAGDNGAGGDPDHDGVTNYDEFRAGTHPRGFFTRSFAEAATGSFYDVRFALFNPDAQHASRVLLRHFTAVGPTVSQVLTLAPRRPITIDPEQTFGLDPTAYSTEITSDLLVVADRTMMWDATHYGSHAETAVAWPSTTWYFAEGATHSGFDLFYLVQNPASTTARVDVTYLLPSGAPVERAYAVPPHSRFNIWVNKEDMRLAASDVSAVFVSQTPIAVERAMYLTQRGRLFDAGHVSAGVASPATRWFLAEGATGDFFDLFVLIANAETRPANVRVTYLLPDGSTIVRTRQVSPKSRTTIYVDREDARLAATAVSTTVESTNGTPILVERAMWWPGEASTWHEAHAAAGATGTSARWALAEGETGGPDGTSTFVLVSNVSPAAGSFRVTLAFEDGTSSSRDVPVPANARSTIDVGASFPESAGKRYAALVESSGASPLDLVVERAMYSNSAGVRWAAGTDSVGIPLSPAGVSSGGAVHPVVTLTSRANGSEAGPSAAAFALARTDATGPLTAYYSILGTASSADYAALSGRVTFATGQLYVSVDITPVDDLVPELEETVVVTLASAPGYVVGREATAAVTISDDDAPSGLAISAADAARFLGQSTMGATAAAIGEVQTKSYSGWIEDQIRVPSTSFGDTLQKKVLLEVFILDSMEATWFAAAVPGADQLRQRVANALVEILVISAANGLGDMEGPPGLAAYMDILMRNAFGNFRTLLEDVTLSPSMGRYLNMLQNDKDNPATGQNPNENYAREVMQLFSIGLYQLNLDGSLRLDATGDPIPTYGQTEVKGFAKVFTGFTFYQPNPPYFFKGIPINWHKPMMPLEEHHSSGPKTLLNGVTLPAGQTALKDVQDALDLIFNHPNVGPFIAYRLIQRLVTSNPSRAYVARVAGTFNDNGAGVRGDLKAVITAILLDAEARQGVVAAGATYGHLKEPMFRLAQVLRAFNATTPTGVFWLLHNEESIGQGPFRSPTVFNFFLPSYARPGPIAAAQLVSPEFQIASETTVIQYANTIRALLYTGFGEPGHLVKLDLAVEQQLAATPDALLNRLDLLLFAGRLSPQLRQIVLDAVLQIPESQLLKRAQVAVYLCATSREFVIQK